MPGPGPNPEPHGILRGGGLIRGQQRVEALKKMIAVLALKSGAAGGSSLRNSRMAGLCDVILIELVRQ